MAPMVFALIVIVSSFYMSFNQNYTAITQTDNLRTSDNSMIPSAVHDVQVTPVTICAMIYDNGTTTLMIDADFWNLGNLSLNTLYIRVDSLEVVMLASSVNATPVVPSVERFDKYVVISIDLETALPPGGHVSVHAELNALDIQSEPSTSTDGIYLSRSLIYYFRPLYQVSNFTFAAVLPPHASLYSQSVSPLFPTSSGNYTDGESLVFLWHLDSIEPGQEQVYIVRYETPLNEASVERIPFTVWLLVGLIIGVVFGFAFPKAIVRFKNSRSVRYVGVSGIEEEVLTLLRTKGGSCPQKILASELDVSQAKVSLVLKTLEDRGIVRRFKEGRENMVHLIER